MSVFAQLSRLEGDGLIQVAATQPELEYLFRHGLIKDAAYFSLVKGDRRALHRAVGETLELHYGQPADDQPVKRELLPALGHHFAEAGDAARALRYFTLAGDAAGRVYANAEAIAHYTRALESAAHTLITAEALTHLYLARGRAQELSGKYAAALANYAELEAAGRQRSESALELAGLVQQVVAYAVPSPNFNAAEAERLAGQALALARTLGDQAAEARLAWARMLAYGVVGNIPAAIRSGENALRLARTLDLPELLAYTLTDLSRVYLSLGGVEQAEAALAEAHRLWRDLNNMPMLVETLNNLGGLAFYLGRYDEAQAHLAEGLRLAESIGNAWGSAYNLMYQSYLLLDRGHMSAALDAMQRCLTYAALGDFVFPQTSIAAAQALAYTYLGQDAAAEAALSRAEQAVAQYLPMELGSVQLLRAWCRLLTGDYAGAADLARQARANILWEDYLTPNRSILTMVEAEVSLQAGHPEQALEAVNAHLNAPHGGGTQVFSTDLRRLRGQALQALGRLDEAEQALLAAHAQAAAQPSYRSLWPICAALARLAAQRGDAAGAERWRAESHRHRDYLAEHITDPAQRAAFLERAEARAPTGPP